MGCTTSKDSFFDRGLITAPSFSRKIWVTSIMRHRTFLKDLFGYIYETFRDEKPVNLSMLGRILLGGILLAVGLMFFVPGTYFVSVMVLKSLQNVELPDVLGVLFAILIVAIGTIALLLSWQCFSGKVIKQHISTPILFIVSVWFLGLSAVIAVEYFGTTSKSEYHTERAIGGSFAIGVLGLWFAYRRRRRKSNKHLLSDGLQPPTSGHR